MRRDFEEYLSVVQKQRTEMLRAVDEANKLLLEGKMTQEQASNIQLHVSLIEANYQRLLYCRYLYSLPPKFIQKLRKKKLEKEADKFKKENADKQAVKEEGEKSLEVINKNIDDAKLQEPIFGDNIDKE